MERRNRRENRHRVMPRNYDGKNSYVTANNQNQPFAISSGTKEEQPESDFSLSKWLHPSIMPRSYVEFLEENSAHIEGDPVVNAMESKAVENVSGTEKKEASPDTAVSRNSLGFKTAGVSSFQTKARKAESSARIQNLHDHEASASFVQSQTLEGSSKKHTLSNFQNRLQQNLAIGKQEPIKDNYCTRSRVSSSRSLSRRRTPARQKAAATDRERMQRIADKIKALQELLPNPAEDCPESTLNKMIAHVKFLQLQIKELSRSRLGGELTPGPFISIEGYGHYIHHEQIMNEPLEEMLAKLLETDRSAAFQLFESKGLCLLPLASVEYFY